MPLETYRLEIRDVDGLGIDVDVYNDDVIEESTHVPYDEYGLEPTDGGPDDSYTEEVTTDVTTLDLQYERDGGGFSFRLLGDRDELTTVRLEDDEWGLQ